MQEYLLLNYPQDVRNNLKKLIKMPKEEETIKSVNKTESAARSKKKGNLQKTSSKCCIIDNLDNQAWSD